MAKQLLLGVTMARHLWIRRTLGLVALTGSIGSGLLASQAASGGIQSPEHPNLRGTWLRTSVWMRTSPDARWVQGDVTTSLPGPLGVSLAIEQTDTSLTIDQSTSVSRNNGPVEHVTIRQVFSFDGSEIAGGAYDSCSTRSGNWVADTFVGHAHTTPYCQPQRSAELALHLETDGRLHAVLTSPGSELNRAASQNAPVMVTATYRRQASGTGLH